ncbi:MAG TPA: AI-2E family transporter [Chthoniobacterales bacterium]
MQIPTPWQKRTLWTAITGLSLLVIAGLVVLVIYLTGKTLSFLQPLLLPVAVAGVLAYLMEPLVAWLVQRKIPRVPSVIIVFAVFIMAITGILIWVVPAIYDQSVRFGKDVPGIVSKVRVLIEDNARKYAPRLPDWGPFKREHKETPPPSPTPLSLSTPVPGATPESGLPQLEPAPAVTDPMNVLFGPEAQKWLQDQIPAVSAKAWQIVQGSIGGFLGVFGFIVGLFIVPVYLFFFLKDADNIAENWSGYLPLRASRFKDEVVVVIEEINGYLIAFFRGQLLVSIIDGILTGTALIIMGLPFALLIGLMVCFLCIIPYLGIILCWLPAVIIAAIEFKDWQHPVAVTVIFIAVQQIEGIFISPKIVGDSVGLHPMTIIISVFAWSLLLGGLLGAILAIPLTATLKVLLTRYVWLKPAKDDSLVPVNGP